MPPTVRYLLLPALLGLALGAGALLVLRGFEAESGPAPTAAPAAAQGLLPQAGFAAAVARAAPAVVNIYSRIREVPPSCLREANLKHWCERP